MFKVKNNAYLPILTSLFLLLAGAVTFAQSTPTSKSESSGQTTTMMTDAQFAKQASQANIAEIKLGHLAEQKGTNSTVQDFGKRMATDHQNAEDNLKAAAAKDNVTLPTTLSAKDQALYDRLSNLSGSSFDREYAKAMVQDHTMDISKFRHEANDGKDSAIKNFASETLPTLQQHLDLADQMSRTVSASNR